jgi:hypothetical protein
MRRLIALVICVLLSGPQASFASQAEPRGTIKGVVLDSTSGQPQRNVDVTLTASTTNGERKFSRRAVTSENGEYSFDRLPVGDDTIYTLDATFDGGTFAGGALRLPSDTEKPPVIDTTLRVRETTSDPDVLVIRSDNIIINANEEGGLEVIESVTVNNLSKRAYIGRGAEMGGDGEGPQPTLGLALPADAQDGSFGIVRSDLNVPDIVRTDFGFAPTVAIPPGDFNFIYTYVLEGSGGTYDFSRSALYSVIEFSVLASGDLTVESNRLTEAGTETIGDRTYRKWTATDYLDPGDGIAISVLHSEGGALTIVAGLLALGLLVLTMGGYILARRRKQGQEQKGLTRDDLLVAIAELDVRKESGELSPREWESERDRLKKELEGAHGGRAR